MCVFVKNYKGELHISNVTEPLLSQHKYLIKGAGTVLGIKSQTAEWGTTRLLTPNQANKSIMQYVFLSALYFANEKPDLLLYYRIGAAYRARLGSVTESKHEGEGGSHGG